MTSRGSANLPPLPEHLKIELTEFHRSALLANGGVGDLETISPDEELARLTHYLTSVEEFIAAERASDLADLHIRAIAVPQQHRAEYVDTFYPIHWELIFEGRLRSSFLVSLISFVEGHLRRVCDKVAIVARSKITSTDLRGSVLERAGKFLAIFGEFKAPSDESSKHLRTRNGSC